MTEPSNKVQDNKEEREVKNDLKVQGSQCAELLSYIIKNNIALPKKVFYLFEPVSLIND